MGHEILEFVAIGTGVVHAKGHHGFKGPKEQPFTSDLSGQDFWTLLPPATGRWKW